MNESMRRLQRIAMRNGIVTVSRSAGASGCEVVWSHLQAPLWPDCCFFFERYATYN